MKYATALLLLGLAMPATAQDYIMPKIPTEQEKVDALKLAYRLNGNSMVGPMIDLTDPRVLEKADRLPLPQLDANPEGGVWPKPNRVRHAEADVCTRHGLRKTATRNGKSWRCK